MKMFELCVNEWIEVWSDWEWFEWRSVPGILNCGFLIVFTYTWIYFKIDSIASLQEGSSSKIPILSP